MGTAAESLNSKLGLDTSDFKTGLDAANRELRVLESGFRASVSTLGDWANSITGVEARQKSLTSQIDIQKAKVDALREEHERLAAANGETSTSAQLAEEKLNKETEKLGKMEVELAGTDTALKNLKEGNDAAGRSTQELGDKQESLGQTFKRSWTEINSMIGVAKQAYQMLKGAVDETVGAFVKYADQVRTISQVTGQSAEDVSRVIQVTDDYKIETDKLNTVMKKMATDGLPLSIDSLANLSDEYLKLNPGAERQLFLTKEFGKAGVDFAEIMLAGGDAIRAKSGAVEKGLILDEAALKKARDFEIAQDNLNDAIRGLAIAAGESAIPALILMAQGLLNVLNGVRDATLGLEEFNRRFGLMPGQVDPAKRSLDNWAKGMYGAAHAAKNLATAADLQALSDQYASVYSAIGTLQGITDNYNKTQGDLIQKQKDAQAAIDAATLAYGAQSPEVQALKTDLDNVNTALGDAATAFENESKRAILAMIAQKAGADGWQEGELEALLKVGEAWGIYSPQVVDQAGNIMAAMDNIDSSNLGDIQAYAEWMIAHPNISQSYDFWETHHVKTISDQGSISATGATVSSAVPAGPNQSSMAPGGAPSVGGEWEYQAGIGQVWVPYLASGGLFDSSIARVGEKGEEWLVHNKKGGVVVLPNKMVRLMEAWGIDPGTGFGDGGLFGASAGGGSLLGLEGGMSKVLSQLEAAMSDLSRTFNMTMNGRAMSGAATGAGAGAILPAGPSTIDNRELHLHVGTLIADRRGLEQLERTLRGIRKVEEARIG
jgi:hypothetical protein